MHVVVILPSPHEIHLNSCFLMAQLNVEVYWKRQTRPDGRVFLQCRRTHLQRGVLRAPPRRGAAADHVAGSALVRMGGTHVLAAVSLQVGQVAAPAQSAGDATVACSPPNPALQSYLQRLVDETTDLDALCLPPDATGTSRQKLAFRLHCGVQVLQDGGNVRDASLLACTAALSDTKLPETVWDQDRIWLQRSDAATKPHGRPLPRSRLAVPLTVGVWADGDGAAQLIVDPGLDEEPALVTRITVVVNAAAACTPGVEGSSAPASSAPPVLSLEMAGEVDTAALALAVKLAGGRARELYPLLQPS